MLKRALIALLLLLTLAFASSAQDTTPDLTKLAGYLPPTTGAYVAIRTDQAYIETIDRLVTAIGRSTGAQISPEGALADIDNQLKALYTNDYGFNALIRNWLGDSVAFAAIDLNFEGNPETIALLEVANRQAAENAFDKLLETASPEKTDLNGATYYKLEGINATSVIVTDGVVYIGSPATIEALVTFIQSEPLSANPVFQQAFARLPEDNYNIFGYLNLYHELLDTVDFEDLPPTLTREQVDALLFSLGAQSFGATIFDDRALTLDLALSHSSQSILSVLGLSELNWPTPIPVDPSFARYAPQDTSFYFQSTGAGDLARLFTGEGLDIALEFVAKYVAPMAEDPQAAAALQFIDPEFVAMLRERFDEAVAAAGGLTPDELFTIINGQNATFVTGLINDDFDSIPAFAQIYENVAPDLSTKLIEAAKNLLTSQEIPFVTEGDILTVNLSDLDPTAPSVNLQFGTTADVIGLATEGVFNFDGGSRDSGLAGVDRFNYEASLMLSGAPMFGYIDIDNLLSVMGTNEPVLSLFDSLGMSAAPVEGASVLRLTATLKTAP